MFEVSGLIVFAVFVAVLLIRHIQRGNVFVIGKSDKREYAFYLGYIFYFYAIVCNLIIQIKLPFDGYMIHIAGFRAAGVGMCCIGLLGMIWCIAKMGASFRVGIDDDTKDRLVTTGIYKYSRNPMYVSIFAIFIGEFLMMPTPLMLLSTFGAFINFHKQILKEEKFLRGHYGAAYEEYKKNVRRYL